MKITKRLIVAQLLCYCLFIALCSLLIANCTPKKSEIPVATEYRIGDTGPAGGIIFYDKGNDEDGWRYLEAAPASTEFASEWGLDDVSLKTGMEIGTGKRNTALITAALARNGETGKAAQIVNAMQVNGFTDWFLPSWEELGLMYHNLYKQGLGGFNENAYYWSSSSFEYGEDAHFGAYNMPFMEDGGMGFARAQNNCVRAVRSFSLGEYSNAEESPHFVHTVEFNNRKIPITVYYAYYDDDHEVYTIDHIAFEYDGKEHTIILPGEMQPFSGIDNFNNYFDRIGVDDYNFDNYMDIDIFMCSGTGGEWRNVYIYNPRTKSYSYQEELSIDPGVWVNPEKQTVGTWGKGGHAGMIYTAKEYKWVNRQLTLIYHEDQDYDEGLELYIRVTRTLQNGEWEYEAWVVDGDNEIVYKMNPQG